MKIQYLPKVWERAREPYGKKAFFSAFPKIQFSPEREEFLLAIAIIVRIKLFFKIFPIKRRVGF
jgi:hypothetical protein